ncbi:MAG: tRNA U34 5-methylaminomethyl-2-thiouridine-forming methyltransferase MnmC [Saprospiraceae bacterium]|jgi:tRNA U34 5-methylaminomethyl-2-thiouridine-forming methyltransferase MnmC
MDKLVFSQDGSHTIISERFGVSYHSKFGSIQETQTVFIDAGLDYIVSRGYREINILEMGFGTGLNAIMTYQSIKGININYHTLEAYPIEEAQYSKLNYSTVLSLTEIQTVDFLKMHKASSGDKTSLSENFDFTKHIIKIEEFSTNEKFDIIYYDAFAPTSQEELWTPELMTKLYGMCNPGAVLVTYCAKGSFKRALRSAGFTVEALDGPEGKREMTRGKVL